MMNMNLVLVKYVNSMMFIAMQFIVSPAISTFYIFSKLCYFHFIHFYKTLLFPFFALSQSPSISIFYTFTNPAISIFYTSQNCAISIFTLYQNPVFPSLHFPKTLTISSCSLSQTLQFC